MSLIQGFAAHAAGAELLSYKYDPGDLKPNEVELAISHCGICRNDIHMVNNDWGISQYPLIPGHEIVGKITAMGSSVLGLDSGDRVGVGWQSNSCGHCEWCLQGEENLCPDSQGTCVHRNGGYADRVRVNARFVYPIPEGLESERAAPLLCGGLTVYSPIRSFGINPASRVGIVGIGGLGHMAVQFAHIFGAEVTAFSMSPAKEADARSLGADQFVNTRESKSLKKLAGYFDFILSTVEADQDWSAYIAALRPHGTLCFVGVPPGNLALPVNPLVSGQKIVTGSPNGSPRMMREMLRVAGRHKVQAITERFAMAKANDAVVKVKKNRVRYRAVLAN
jgi:alcohol/geraniol dehydrogenase (NADP+)